MEGMYLDLMTTSLIGISVTETKGGESKARIRLRDSWAYVCLQKSL